MKIKLITSLLVGLSASSLYAVTTISATNKVHVDTTDRGIVDNAGNFIGTGLGSIEVGYFSALTTSLDFSSANRSQLLNDFHQFTTTTKSFTDPSNADGFYTVSFSDNITAGSPFIGKNMYTVIGNSSSLNNSTDFIIFKHNVVFEEEQAGLGAGNAIINPNNGTLMLGSDAGNKVHPLGPTVGTYKMALVPVPEPSSIALLGLGLVGFTLRRRR